MRSVSPQSPEERRLHPERGVRLNRRLAFMAPGSYLHEIGRRVLSGVLADGFIHAGNLAYLSLLTLFPFFIVAAALAQLVGRTEVGLNAVETFLQSVPPEVADVLKDPIRAALGARSGRALWLGALVCLWSTTSFVETIRDILRRAYGVQMIRPFWHYRLFSIVSIIGSLLLVLLAFSLQVTLVAAEQLLSRLFPFATDARLILTLTKFAPPLALFGALYALFYTLTPPQYRESRAPKWPGALLTALWWIGVTTALPFVLSNVVSYDLTYGGLAGVMVALIFFFLVGLGLVVGAQLNAALAEAEEQGVRDENTMEIAA
ncbi:YihY/virulence factor BrkB family protein [Sphingomonas sp.]|uniref:YihY/virulence factor BrkB family protein n=1 Tax=Sphingomonas sp. TaxID=28214 RepID=UPI001D670786|nr:YihY/virulence factor BrkB family protein [Sphingomonas sp.]MBX9797399.1 YihY/virulence factor BrkB family protein [Sphingomonas sp.]